MGSPQFERDLQYIDELCECADRDVEGAAEKLEYFVGKQAEKMSPWQWIIHGDTTDYRKTVTKWLIEKRRFVTSKRFALCGRGDVFVETISGAKIRVKPHGCGLRCCPRCSRRAGRSALSRVASHLSSEPHGLLYHIVLTQRVVPVETLSDARERFKKSWTRFYSMIRKMGMSAALATYHIKPSNRQGWHYHCHLLAEMKPQEGIDEATQYQLIDSAWNMAMKETEELKPLFMRKVSDPGEAMVELADGTQMELFNEAKDEVTRVLQYMLRDILQGIESWVSELTGEEQAKEFIDVIASKKLHRCYGTWRKKIKGSIEEEVEAEEKSIDSATCEAPTVERKANEWYEIMGMDNLLFAAKNGLESAKDRLKRLSGTNQRKVGVALRLWTVVKSIVGS